MEITVDRDATPKRKTLENARNLETTPKTLVHELTIAVHALSSGVGGAPTSRFTQLADRLLRRRDFADRQRIHGQRRKVLERMVEHFAPRRYDDVFMYMPMNIGKDTASIRENVIVEKHRKKYDPKAVIWPELYNAVKRTSIVRRNVMFAPDIIFDSDHQFKPENVVKTLEQKGFKLTDRTVITFGGEYIQLCLQSAASQILGLPEVRRIRIDKQASLDADYQQGSAPNTEFVKMLFAVKPVNILEDENYIYVEKSTRQTTRF
jgi:hypothetical protein